MAGVSERKPTIDPTTPTTTKPPRSRFWHDSNRDGPMKLGHVTNKKTGERTYPDGRVLQRHE